jgi:predicted ester cyclase
MPPTGKQVSYTVLMVDRIRDGVIVHHWALPDILSIFRQVGKPLLSVPEVTPPSDVA